MTRSPLGQGPDSGDLLLPPHRGLWGRDAQGFHSTGLALRFFFFVFSYSFWRVFVSFYCLSFIHLFLIVNLFLIGFQGS